MRMIFNKDRSDYSSQKGLIKACKRNDSKAQMQLYNQYYKAMYAVALNLVKDVQLAEDLMQEAFLKAFERISSFKGEVSFGAWLKKIVINKCLDHLKKKKVIFEEIDTIRLPDVSENDESLAERERTVEEIKNEIGQLPDGYRTILTLFLLEGYDHAEIAEILGITSSTSRSQYTRAKALLVKRLNKKDE